MITNLVAIYWHLFLLFFAIAILYSSVGFGGGSSYLAILALTGIAFTQIRSISLLCNITVVSLNVFHFQKQRLYDWKKVIPIISFSIPLAFIGGFIEVNKNIFFISLGFTLLMASLVMWFNKKIVSKRVNASHINLTKSSSYAGIIGFISGMVGIGGGIFLAPLLHLRQWDTPKRIAATASLFILLNSISGILGYSLNSGVSVDWNLTIMLIIVVLVGSFLGNKISKQFLTPIQIKKGTALLIAFVSIRILIKYLL
ncbi:sulfite exporter TauE/SafE family protein [Flavobacteriaceae bacterium]|nr:sulfite exporter TauE/SafE family protein [Flavobacteriaceae bacterium]